MSSPSSSSSATAGSRRSRRRSRSTLGPVAAAVLAAATAWTPLPLGVLAPAVAPVLFLGALVFYFVVAPSWFAALAETLNLAALFVGGSALLVGGCLGDAAGHVGAGVWAASLAVAVPLGTWALLEPRRRWWVLPLATLAGAAIVVGLAIAFTGNTGLCPD